VRQYKNYFKVKNIEFKSISAQRIYNDYLKRVERTISILSEKDKLDMLMEINSHIYEAMQQDGKENEIDKLLITTENLGLPEEFLIPVVAEKKLIQAVHTFNPKHVWQALKMNISNGLGYSIVSILYLGLSVFGFLIFTKFFFPSKTGLFYMNNEFKAFGFISNADEMNEVLGFWFFPITIVSAVIIYVLITLLLGMLKSK
tara:strand:- start:234 stop:836 length:603 start_codon:yes stop_codon:yes gene_type:complete